MKQLITYIFEAIKKLPKNIIFYIYIFIEHMI